MALLHLKSNQETNARPETFLKTAVYSFCWAIDKCTLLECLRIALDYFYLIGLLIL